MRGMQMSRLKALPFILLMTAILLPYAQGKAAKGNNSAANITSKCKFTASSGTELMAKLHDGKHDTAWASAGADGSYVQVTLPKNTIAGGIYIMWNEVPEGWQLLESSGGSVWSPVELGSKAGYINAFVPLDGQAAKLRIESTSYKWKMSIAEIKVLGEGTLPQDVQVWLPSPEKADLMVIPAHPDDELIYLGGTLPYYAGELHKHTVVVYMTSSPVIRKFEALDGLWKVGVREYPVFLPLANKYTSTVEDAELAWDGLDNSVSLLVEQIRRYKPDVVVTHDLNGEYGHGAHKLTALATEKAVDAAGNAGKYPDSAEEYGSWQVKKCYLHLYSKNKIEMDWNKPLEAFDGKTALDMAREGYALHVSQHFRDRPIEDTGEYDNAAYGLYYTSVGADKKGGDFFENIALATSPKPTKSAAEAVSVSVLPSPSGTAEDEEDAMEDVIPTFSGKISPTGTAWETSVAIAVVLLLAVFGITFNNHVVLKKARHAKKKS